MIKFKQLYLLYFLDPSIRGFMIMAESEIKAGSESDVISPSEQGLDFDEETLKGNITVYYQRTEGQKQHF